MELITNQIATLVHFKDNEPVAITITNGKTTLYSLKEMTAADIENFYETNTTIAHE